MDEAPQEPPTTQGRRIETTPTATQIPPHVHDTLVEFVKDRFNLQQASKHVDCKELSSPNSGLLCIVFGDMNRDLQWELSREKIVALGEAIATSNIKLSQVSDAAQINGYTLFGSGYFSKMEAGDFCEGATNAKISKCRTEARGTTPEEQPGLHPEYIFRRGSPDADGSVPETYRLTVGTVA